MFKGNNSWIRWQAETPAACPAFFFYSEIPSAIVTDIHRAGMAAQQDSIYCVSLFGSAGGSVRTGCINMFQNSSRCCIITENELKEDVS